MKSSYLFCLLGIMICLSGCDILDHGDEIVNYRIVSSEGDFRVWDITYQSDTLLVKGYIAIPKKRNNLPCIIFCR